MFERNDVNAVVITTVATNAEYFFMPVYFAPKKDVRNHRIITFSQIVAIISVTVESSPILIPRKFYHSLLDFFGFCSADRERAVIGKDNIIAFYRKNEACIYNERFMYADKSVRR